MIALLLLVFLGITFAAAYVIASFAASKYTTTSAANKGDVSYHDATPKSTDPAWTASAATTANPPPTISIVIPCYNEEERLPRTLDDTLAFMDKAVKQRGLFSAYELIVVDDCSSDKTAQVALDYAAKQTAKGLIRLVKVRPNHGKGYAVRAGFFAAQGTLVLMADGDNATSIDDLAKLVSAMQGSSSNNTTGGEIQVAVGSRAHLEQQSVSERTLFRTILMRAFHLIVAVTYLVGAGRLCHIHDTQCGFKLFRRKDLEKVFLNNRLERWAFDVEVLILCSKFGYRVVEIPVTWREMEGSKMRVSGMIQMGLECVLMCFAYSVVGLWPANRHHRPPSSEETQNKGRSAKSKQD